MTSHYTSHMVLGDGILNSGGLPPKPQGYKRAYNRQPF